MIVRSPLKAPNVTRLKMSFTKSFTPSFTQLSLTFLLLSTFRCLPDDLLLYQSISSLSLTWIYIDIYLSVSIITSQLLTVHSLTLISVFIFFVVLCFCFVFLSFVFSPSVLHAQ